MLYKLQNECDIVFFVIHCISRVLAFEPLNNASMPTERKIHICMHVYMYMYMYSVFVRKYTTWKRIFRKVQSASTNLRCLPIFEIESASDQRFAYPTNIGSSGLRACGKPTNTGLVPDYAVARTYIFVLVNREILKRE